MLKTLKNYEVLDLVEAFNVIGRMGIESNKKFSYAIILNDEAIKSRVKAITEIAKPSEDYIEYETKRNDIIREYGSKDANGNIILTDDRWVNFDDDVKEKAISLINDLNKEYSTVIDKRNNDIDDYNAILEEEHEYDITMVSLDDVPDDVGKDVMLLKMLMYMVNID